MKNTENSNQLIRNRDILDQPIRNEEISERPIINGDNNNPNKNDYIFNLVVANDLNNSASSGIDSLRLSLDENFKGPLTHEGGVVCDHELCIADVTMPRGSTQLKELHHQLASDTKKIVPVDVLKTPQPLGREALICNKVSSNSKAIHLESNSITDCSNRITDFNNRFIDCNKLFTDFNKYGNEKMTLKSFYPRSPGLDSKVNDNLGLNFAAKTGLTDNSAIIKCPLSPKITAVKEYFQLGYDTFTCNTDPDDFFPSLALADRKDDLRESDI